MRDVLLQTLPLVLCLLLYLRMRDAERRHHLQLQVSEDRLRREVVRRFEDVDQVIQNKTIYRSDYCQHCGRGTP